MSGGSISSMWGFISKFFCFFFIPPHTSTSGSNNTGIHTLPPNSRASNFIPLHTMYAYLTGLLLALIEIKYQGSSSDPFEEHPVIMLLFLITKFVYVCALLTFQFHQIDYHLPNFKFVVCHVSGTLACELLVLLLFPPIKWFIINVSSPVLVVTTFFGYKYILRLLNSAETQSSEIHNEEEGQAPVVVDVPAKGEITEEGQAREMAGVQAEAQVPSPAQ